MKKVLSLLVAFVFLQVQTWAYTPNYGAVNNSVSGTYAGVLSGSLGSNGLGLFQIGMPTAGLGSGTFAFYVGGGAFFGTVVALADGEKDTLSGVLTGVLQETVFIATVANGTTTLQPQTVDVALMGGQFVATITGNTDGTTTIGVGARLSGTAQVNILSAGNIFVPAPTGLTVPSNTTLTLDGFQQSATVTGQVSLSSLTNTTQASGGG